MLIEFSVANFMSLKERQTFSMVAAKSKELDDTHTFTAPMSSGKEIKLLRSAAIYGANAAGKTSLLDAIYIMSEIVTKSAFEKNRGDPLPVKPFKLDSKTRNAPCEFEIHLIIKGVRYQYGFSATPERITAEWLTAYPHNRAQHWFSREWLPTKKIYEWEFGASLSGEKEVWKNATRDNALFLSTSVQLNSEKLQPLYDWFKEQMIPPERLRAGKHFSVALCNEGKMDKVLDFLKAADLGIDDMRVNETTLTVDSFADDVPEQARHAFLKDIGDTQVYEVTIVHSDRQGQAVAFEFNEESDGTQQIFAFAGCWIDALENGRLIVIDELHNHLHPELVKFLIQLLHNDKANPHNAQLVFTTHETGLLNQKLMRRDQIWFCEKNKNNETTVYPLSDFRPRKGRENLEMGYLSGVYGALPYLQTSGELAPHSHIISHK